MSRQTLSVMAVTIRDHHKATGSCNALQMIGMGAQVIDVGENLHPGASPVEVEEEIRRYSSGGRSIGKMMWSFRLIPVSLK